jgi:hypothetical protein
MTEGETETRQSPRGRGMFGFLWEHKVWWLFPLVVLLFLIGIIYVLGHMSAADPETYPTSRLNNNPYFHVC